MYEELVKILNQMAGTNPAETVNFRAMIMFKDHLIAADIVSRPSACEISAVVKFNLNEDLNDEKLAALIVPFTKIVVGIITAYTEHDYTVQDFLNIANTLSLTLE